MKKLSNLFVLLTLLLCVSLSSCSNDNDENEMFEIAYGQNLIGTWKCADDRTIESFTFKIDKSATHRFTDRDSGKSSEMNVTWSYDSNAEVIIIVFPDELEDEIASFNVYDGYFTDPDGNNFVKE